MKEAAYKNMLAQIGKREKLKKFISFWAQFSTFFMYIFFPIYGAVIFYLDRKLPLKETLIPFVSFVILSVIRKLINAPRPYEVLDIKPLKNKKTKGVSFPSRHTFSAFIIAFCVFSRFPILGVILLFLSLTLGVCRILLGVHFIKDIVAGFLFAFVSSIFFYVF